MCSACEAHTQAVIDAAHRIRAGHDDWAEVISDAADIGDADCLAEMAAAGARIVAHVMRVLARMYQTPELASAMDAEHAELLIVRVLDEAAATAWATVHAEQDGSAV
jgi:hypothetical protein